MIYVALALTSFLVAAAIIALIYNLNVLIDAVKHLGERRPVVHRTRLHLIRYVVRSKRPPYSLEIRHSPYKSAPPSPVFDGKIRRPWGW